MGVRTGSGWVAPTATEPVDATVVVPGSKSLMARALVLAWLADAPTTVHRPLLARDSLLMAEALRALGARVTTDRPEAWQVHPGRAARDAQVDCGLSGTVMRFVPPLAALGTTRVTFDGDRRARARPMRGLLTGLRDLGVEVTPLQATTLPVTVHGAGSVHGGSLTVDARESSQFVSGLLMAGCRFTEGLALHVAGVVPSAPHIAMTVHALLDRGVPARATGPTSWLVPPTPPSGGEVTIEPDVSNAAPFLAAALVTGGRVRIPGWPTRTTQPAAALLRLLSGFGGQVVEQPDGLEVVGSGDLAGLGTVDLGDVGELAPTIVALAALADGPTTVTGVAHLRGHETDRLAALTAALRSLGAHAEQTPDGLRVEPAPMRGTTVASRGDHRMATFAAIIGLRVPDVVIDDVSVTSKTLPDFPAMWQAMLA